jgi:hypothetical protein
MADRKFVQLNNGWNAEPNAPYPRITVNGSQVTVEFLLNPFLYEAEEDERGLLAFSGCSKWRLGSTNDEGWYRGQCRYSGIAPKWGEFYEITGADALAHSPVDWNATKSASQGSRHFLFYFRDETFECFANDWALARSR